MTVSEAVLRVLIEHYPRVKNYIVQASHPAFQLSGLTRLRELNSKGIVDYYFDPLANEYVIKTPKEKLQQALTEIQTRRRSRRSSEHKDAGPQGGVGPHKPEPAGSSPAPATNREPEKCSQHEAPGPQPGAESAGKAVTGPTALQWTPPPPREPQEMFLNI